MSAKRVQYTTKTTRTLADGTVVTETKTEYREVRDSQFESEFKGVDFDDAAGKAQTKSESESDGEDNVDSFEEEALAAHNKYRAKHGVGPLTLDKELCNYAKNWAVHLANRGRFEHNPARKYGENIYMSSSSNRKAKCPGSAPVDAWYSEVSKYNFRSGRDDGLQAGHFTQVVWKDSKRLGIALVKNNNNTIVVANYDPPGNFIGDYINNVFE